MLCSLNFFAIYILATKVQKSERKAKFQRERAKGRTRFFFAERGGNSIALSLLVCFSANASTFTACRKVRKSERNIKFTLIFLSERSTFTACRKVRKSEQNGYQSGISLNSNQRIVFSSSSSLRSERRMDFAVSSSAVREPVQSASSIAAFSASSSAMADSTAANS